MPACPQGKRGVVRHTHHTGPRQILHGLLRPACFNPTLRIVFHIAEAEAKAQCLRSSTTIIRCGSRRPSRPEPTQTPQDPELAVHKDGNRIGSLFTMLNHRRCAHTGAASGSHPSFRTAMVPNWSAPRPQRGSARMIMCGSNMVEPDGIEPTTSCLQSRRSPS